MCRTSALRKPERERIEALLISVSLSPPKRVGQTGSLPGFPERPHRRSQGKLPVCPTLAPRFSFFQSVATRHEGSSNYRALVLGLVEDEFESFGASQMMRMFGSAVWNSIRVISRLNIASRLKIASSIARSAIGDSSKTGPRFVAVGTIGAVAIARSGNRTGLTPGFSIVTSGGFPVAGCL